MYRKRCQATNNVISGMRLVFDDINKQFMPYTNNSTSHLACFIAESSYSGGTCIVAYPNEPIQISWVQNPLLQNKNSHFCYCDANTTDMLKLNVGDFSGSYNNLAITEAITFIGVFLNWGTYGEFIQQYSETWRK